jgi:hypothetical protein
MTRERGGIAPRNMWCRHREDEGTRSCENTGDDTRSNEVLGGNQETIELDNRGPVTPCD